MSTAPTIQLQRRQQPLGVQAQIVRLALLAPAQVMGRMLGAQLFQVQRDPHAVCRGGTPVAMQDHVTLSLSEPA